MSGNRLFGGISDDKLFGKGDEFLDGGPPKDKLDAVMGTMSAPQATPERTNNELRAATA